MTGAGTVIGRSIAVRLADEGARLTLLARDEERLRDAVPGAVTGLKRDEAFAEAMREVPLRRMSEPAEIVGTVAWLLSPDAVGVTGQAIDHNNGAFMS